MVKLLALKCILATLAVTTVMAAPVQSPSGGVQAEEADCSTLIYDLMDCMEFLIVGGTETTPQKSCCAGFETVFETDADCICYALSNSGSLGLDVNMTRAQALAPSCGVSVDPIGACHVSDGSSVGSPANTPTISAPPSNSLTLPPAATVGAPVETPSGIAPSPRLLATPSSIAPSPHLLETPSDIAPSPRVLATPSDIAPSPRLSSIAAAPDSEAPAPAPKKSAAYATSATFSTLLVVISPLLFIA